MATSLPRPPPVGSNTSSSTGGLEWRSGGGGRGRGASRGAGRPPASASAVGTASARAKPVDKRPSQLNLKAEVGTNKTSPAQPEPPKTAPPAASKSTADKRQRAPSSAKLPPPSVKALPSKTTPATLAKAPTSQRDAPATNGKPAAGATPRRPSKKIPSLVIDPSSPITSTGPAVPMTAPLAVAHSASQRGSRRPRNRARNSTSRESSSATDDKPISATPDARGLSVKKEAPPHLSVSAAPHITTFAQRHQMDNLADRVRGMAGSRASSPGSHIDWAGDEDDTLPDLDDWGYGSSAVEESGNEDKEEKNLRAAAISPILENHLIPLPDLTATPGAPPSQPLPPPEAEANLTSEADTETPSMVKVTPPDPASEQAPAPAVPERKDGALTLDELGKLVRSRMAAAGASVNTRAVSPAQPRSVSPAKHRSISPARPRPTSPAKVAVAPAASHIGAAQPKPRAASPTKVSNPLVAPVEAPNQENNSSQAKPVPMTTETSDETSLTGEDSVDSSEPSEPTTAATSNDIAEAAPASPSEDTLEGLAASRHAPKESLEGLSASIHAPADDMPISRSAPSHISGYSSSIPPRPPFHGHGRGGHRGSGSGSFALQGRMGRPTSVYHQRPVPAYSTNHVRTHSSPATPSSTMSNGTRHRPVITVDAISKLVKTLGAPPGKSGRTAADS